MKPCGVPGHAFRCPNIAVQEEKAAQEEKFAEEIQRMLNKMTQAQVRLQSRAHHFDASLI